VKKVHKMGFKVLSTVCDQDGVHRSLFHILGVSKDNPASVVGVKIHFFYDSPHLLKSPRNTFKV